MKQNRPPIATAHNIVNASRNAGAFRGSLSNWRPPVTVTRDQEMGERKLSQMRAADLAVNDWAANSGINSIAQNVVGAGLRPQARVDYKALGITRDQGLELQADMERIWAQWSPRAHVRSLMSFEDLQFLGLRTMLRLGELLFVPVMRPRPVFGSPVSLAIQDISPLRLKTPFDKVTDPLIVDGVEHDAYGAPVAYWIATPPASVAGEVYNPSALTSSDFTRVPAHIGHRPGCFHLYRHLEEEQVRGESVLRSGINLFRHLADALDNEVLAQVISSSFAVFIQKEQEAPLPPGVEKKEGHTYQYFDPGTVAYGNAGEKPVMLETAAPSSNWASFCELCLRFMAASIDMPYEVLVKDFSKTNYSSARAAMNEAWRVFGWYKNWLVRHLCEPVWGMVMEEAWLSGRLKLPAGAPDWYDAVDDYCRALWIGPPRGYVDPTKEIAATVESVNNGFMTRSEAVAERGRDFEEVVEELEEEEARLSGLKLLGGPGAQQNPQQTGSASDDTAPGASSSAGEDDGEDEEDEDGEGDDE